MKVIIKLSDAEYDMLKAYAATRRKYEVGKGYRVDDAIAQAISIGVDAISETTILDSEGNIVDWKKGYKTEDDSSSKRSVYRKY